MLLRDMSTHGVLRVTGADRVRFLNGMFTNDVARLAPGQGVHAAMLTVKGKLLGDALILADDDFLLVDIVPAARDKVRDNLDRHLIVDEVVLEDEPAGLLAVHGEDAAAALAAALGVAPAALPEAPYQHSVLGGLRVVRADELGLPGYRVHGDTAALSARLLTAGGRWLAADEEEQLRVLAGQARYGVDMGEDHLPMEAGLDDAVSLTKGCYMGQEVIARLTARGHINRKLVTLRLEGEAAGEPGSRIAGPGRDEAGVVTSAARAPDRGVVALGYVHRSLWEPGTALVVHEAAGPRGAVVLAPPAAPAVTRP